MTELFAKIPKQILASKGLSATAKLVYAAIRDRVGNNLDAFPGMARVATDTGVSRPTAIRARNELVRAGLMVMHRGAGPRGASRYQFPAVPTRQGGSHVKGLGMSTGVTPSRKGSLHVPGNGLDTNEIQTDQPMRPNPCCDRADEVAGDMADRIAREPRRRSSKPTEDAWDLACTALSEPSCLRTKQFRVAWGEWAEHRRQQKKPLTPATIAKQVKMLEAYGHERAIKSIEQSILRGWQGLFEAKDVQERSTAGDVVQLNGKRADRGPLRQREYPEPIVPLPRL